MPALPLSYVSERASLPNPGDAPAEMGAYNTLMLMVTSVL
jgi:hypothetical protein